MQCSTNGMLPTFTYIVKSTTVFAISYCYSDLLQVCVGKLVQQMEKNNVSVICCTIVVSCTFSVTISTSIFEDIGNIGLMSFHMPILFRTLVPVLDLL